MESFALEPEYIGSYLPTVTLPIYFPDLTNVRSIINVNGEKGNTNLEGF